jgi:hypothetical protein
MDRFGSVWFLPKFQKVDENPEPDIGFSSQMSLNCGPDVRLRFWQVRFQFELRAELKTLGKKHCRN